MLEFKNMPKLFKITFQTIGIILLTIAAASFLIFLINLLLYPYYHQVSFWRILLILSFAGLGFIGGYGLWKRQKWTIIVLGANFINVLIAQFFKLTHQGTCCSTTPPFAATAVLLSGGVLLLVYFSRRHLNGILLKWLPIILFAAFLILNQISLTRLLGVW